MGNCCRLDNLNQNEVQFRLNNIISKSNVSKENIFQNNLDKENTNNTHNYKKTNTSGNNVNDNDDIDNNNDYLNTLKEDFMGPSEKIFGEEEEDNYSDIAYEMISIINKMRLQPNSFLEISKKYDLEKNFKNLINNRLKNNVNKPSLIIYPDKNYDNIFHYFFDEKNKFKSFSEKEDDIKQILNKNNIIFLKCFGDNKLPKDNVLKLLGSYKEYFDYILNKQQYYLIPIIFKQIDKDYIVMDFIFYE